MSRYYRLILRKDGFGTIEMKKLVPRFI